jgi:hypothetical protein
MGVRRLQSVSLSDNSEPGTFPAPDQRAVKQVEEQRSIKDRHTLAKGRREEPRSPLAPAAAAKYVALARCRRRSPRVASKGSGLHVRILYVG